MSDISDAFLVSQFMVRDVVEAKIWHPVSYVRQRMLKHAFSYLPIWHQDTWWLIPEYTVAQYLRGAPSQNDRKKRLATAVCDAIRAGDLKLLPAQPAIPGTQIAEILPRIGEGPILVVDPSRKDVLLGVLTSSDVL
jgi:CBS-domain-containing membrane protein